MNGVSLERLREVFDYDPDSGAFHWKARVSIKSTVGGTAGDRRGDRYVRLGLDGSRVYAHRAAWAMTHGAWPEHHIDHINGDKKDNRLSNLRVATNSQNMQNQRRANVGSTSSYLGVSRRRGMRKWAAKIQIEGKCHHLGYFHTEQAAHGAYLAAKAELHPYSPPNGREGDERG